MQLCYRGIKYEHNATDIPMTSSEILGKYRGIPFTVERHTLRSLSQPTVSLQYRGATYAR